MCFPAGARRAAPMAATETQTPPGDEDEVRRCSGDCGVVWNHFRSVAGSLRDCTPQLLRRHGRVGWWFSPPLGQRSSRCYCGDVLFRCLNGAYYLRRNAACEMLRSSTIAHSAARLPQQIDWPKISFRNKLDQARLVGWMVLITRYCFHIL